MIRTHSLPQAYQTAVSNDRQEIVADAPIDKGGGGAGFGAHELLESAFAACLNMAVRMHAQKHSIPLQSVIARVRLDRSRNDAVRFEYALELGGPLSEAHRGELEHAAETCPVRQTLSKRIEFGALKRTGGD